MEEAREDERKRRGEEADREREGRDGVRDSFETSLQRLFLAPQLVPLRAPGAKVSPPEKEDRAWLQARGGYGSLPAPTLP